MVQHITITDTIIFTMTITITTTMTKTMAMTMAFNDHDHDHDHDQTRPLPYYIVLLCHVPIPYCTTPYRTIPDLHHMRTHPSYAMPCYASNLHDEEAEDVLDEDNHHDAPARR